ncbi:MAG: hypothetical protein CMF62_02370 [Magnetococcales bacterium]|nr:hypothetical protein [Magnetococcales bacterium]|tara:strand:+ start:20724 stop:21221 length:498 start_codon:yes stop_codon:yes gene_type:complete
MSKIDNNELFKELIEKQKNDLPISLKLQFNDIKRICKYINQSIFDHNNCVIWDGYVTNINNQNKGKYINFYFRKKKVALHRLLYTNFIGDLSDNEYLKFSCENKGTCCNVYHLNKFTYNKPIDRKKNKVPKKKEIKKKENENKITIINKNTCDKDTLKLLYLEFD